MEYLFKCNVDFSFAQQNWIQLQIRGVFDATAFNIPVPLNDFICFGFNKNREKHCFCIELIRSFSATNFKPSYSIQFSFRINFQPKKLMIHLCWIELLLWRYLWKQTILIYQKVSYFQSFESPVWFEINSVNSF